MGKKAKEIPTLVKNKQLVLERREQIVRGAVELFARKGFHKTTTREIANECGISIGSLYEYIQTKEDVLYLVCEYIHSKFESQLKEAVREEDTGKESLKKAALRYFRTVGEMSDHALLIYQETKSLPPETMKHVLQMEEEITSVFEGILEKGIRDGTISLDPSLVKLMAHNIMVLGQMWTFRGWALSRQYLMDEFVYHQTSLLLDKLCS